MIRCLISLKKFDINKQGGNYHRTVLLITCCHDEVDIVEYIARYDGVDRGVKDSEGNNTRHITCELVGIEMMKILIALNEYSAILIDIEYKFGKNIGGKSSSYPSASKIKKHAFTKEDVICKVRLK